MSHHHWLLALLLISTPSFAGSPSNAAIWNDLTNEPAIGTSMYEVMQSDTDRVHMKNGKVYVGEVKTVKERTIEFFDFDTQLNYEFPQSDIEVILLSNGKTLTFTSTQLPSQPAQQPQQPVVIKEEGGASVGLIILASVGAVLLVLLLIGAAAQ